MEVSACSWLRIPLVFSRVSPSPYPPIVQCHSRLILRLSGQFGVTPITNGMGEDIPARVTSDLLVFSSFERRSLAATA